MKWVRAILQRMLDILLSGIALAVLTPVFTLACVRAAVCRVPVLLRRPVVTESGRTFRRFYFSRLRCMASLPMLFNILRGDMTIDIRIDVNIKAK